MKLKEKISKKQFSGCHQLVVLQCDWLISLINPPPSYLADREPEHQGQIFKRASSQAIGTAASTAGCFPADGSVCAQTSTTKNL